MEGAVALNRSTTLLLSEVSSLLQSSRNALVQRRKVISEIAGQKRICKSFGSRVAAISDRLRRESLRALWPARWHSWRRGRHKSQTMRNNILSGDPDTFEGLVIQLRRSKSDQEAQGRQVAIPFGAGPETCTVRAFEDWIAAAGIEAGPVFRGSSRHGRLADNALISAAVALLVKDRRSEPAWTPPSMPATACGQDLQRRRPWVERPNGRL